MNAQMDDSRYKWVMDLYHYAAGEVLKSTVKLYTNESGRMRPHGSGVLFRFGNDHYLFTAAHCIFQKGHQIKIACLDNAGYLHALRGPVVYKRGAENKIDLAIVKLSATSVAALNGIHIFLDGLTQIMLNVGIKEETEYLISAHPNSKTNVNFTDRKIQYAPLVHIGKSVPSEKLKEYGFNPASHICIGFHQRKSHYFDEDFMSMAPDPTGISGSGLWYIPSYDVSQKEDVAFFLSGILTEHHRDKSIMVATKVEELADMIKGMLDKDSDAL